MINILFSRICMLTCGTLYPGYVSFKTVRAKVVNDYIKWMMYWIVFALFTVMETFTDIFFTWFPFYYEIKVILIFWLLPTTGNGSSFIYKNLVHPLLMKHETRIDQYLEQVREKGRDLILQYMKKSFSYIKQSVTNIINKNIPDLMMTMLSNTTDESVRSLPESNRIIIEEMEEEEEPHTSVQKPVNRKHTKTTTSRSTEDASAARPSRNRMRKTTRNPKQDNEFES